MRIWEWNGDEFDCTHILAYRQNHPVQSLAFNFDGSCVAATGDNCVMIWNLYETEEKAVTFETRKYADLSSVAFSPAAANGSILVAVEKDNALWAWDVENKKRVNKLEEQVDDPESVAFSSDGKKLAVGSKLGRVEMYDTSTWSRRFDNIQVGSSGNRISMDNISFSPNGFQFCALGDNIEEEQFNDEFAQDYDCELDDSELQELMREENLVYMPETLFIFKYGL